MPHTLVQQFKFTRREFQRCLEGVSDEDALKRIDEMNSISWMVGHLANHEHRMWVQAAQGKTLYPDLASQVGSGSPASTPPLAEMWDVWSTVTASADVYLDKLTEDDMLQTLTVGSKPSSRNIGTDLLRNTYHYWFHIGEAHAVRQMLRHSDIPQFVAPMRDAPYGIDR
ncbi:MAG: DinB family protein [Chloroflexi bacterium]|nr:DinB family protein [Chloroflexota bacterium]